jgi:hypothetical protein
MAFSTNTKFWTFLNMLDSRTLVNCFVDRLASYLIVCTGDSRYTRFCCPCFRLSSVLFQYHEEHQYHIRGHVRSCRAGPLSCARSFTDSPHHFYTGDHKLRSLMVYHSENTRTCYTFSVLRVFDLRGNSQERSPRV